MIQEMLPETMLNNTMVLELDKKIFKTMKFGQHKTPIGLIWMTNPNLSLVNLEESYKI